MKKRGKSQESGANWMDTYGDLVTLLLCFFVLLYSISTIDQAKWVQIVKSFNPEAKDVSQIADPEQEDAVDDVPGSPEADEFDDLYESLKKAIEQAGLDSEVELFKGDGYSFITFRDNVFFDGDSSVIKEGGETILAQFASIISGVSSSVKEIEVLGHTTQADPNVPNDATGDRVLSAERAARVAAYLQERTNVSPANITKSDAVEHSLEEYYKDMGRQ